MTRELVIKIDKNTYNRIISGFANEDDAVLFENLLKNGTPLPKGHGRLVDISKIDEDRIESDNPIIYLTIDGQYTEAISLRYL